ncbi:peptidoglycan-binding protein [Streptomyces griseus]|uniref:peptidoglycan-binding domain-containing protein n=1 Tax=Streptomyces griseus TaxID=1911 RepID=UPI00068F1A78|nr:peptidoglycan-binding domain-containing protein [Streptomyces griseus]
MRRKFTAAALAILSVTGLLASSATAHASVSNGYISGSGSLLDDLGDEGDIHPGNISGATAVWQAILWADGYLDFSYASSVDCNFGPATKAATKAWQADHDLDDDGIVGKKTFSAAGKYLIDAGLSATNRNMRIVEYDSPKSSLRVIAQRNETNGRWLVMIGSSATYRYASYTSC